MWVSMSCRGVIAPHPAFSLQRWFAQGGRGGILCADRNFGDAVGRIKLRGTGILSVAGNRRPAGGRPDR